MPRILLITHIFPPAVDGGSRVIAKIGEYLSQNNHEIIVLTTDASGTDDFTRNYKPNIFPTSHPFPVHRLPVYTIFHRPLKLLNKLFTIFRINCFLVFSKGPLFRLVPFLKFLVVCLRFSPEYIIAGPLPTTTVLYARFIKFYLSLHALSSKLIINASFHESDPQFFQSPLITSLKKADLVWTLTRHETEYFRKNFDINPSRMIQLGNGVDSSLLSTKTRPHPDIGSLLFIGSFAAHKGIGTLIDAFSLLSQTPPHYRGRTPTLTLAGQPTLYSPVLEAKIRHLPGPIRSRIKLIYSFKSGDLPRLLDRCSLLISPSVQESFGLVLLEAMARGVPVIAADIPVSSELVNKSHAGLLFKANDPQDLARKIKIFLASTEKLERCSANARAFASAHTWDRIGKSLWQKFLSL